MQIDPNHVKGIDVAKWEPQVDFHKVKAAGFKFVFVKVSQGINPDSRFKQHWERAKGVIPRGPYHFWDPQYLHVTPEIAAEKFWSLIEHDPGELPPVIDLEIYRTGPWVGSQNWYRWCKRLEALSGKKEVIIYTAQSFFNTEIGRLPKVADTSFFARKDLWIADPDKDDFNPDMPALWSNWAFRQYSWVELIDGITTDIGGPAWCDANVFHGTEEELYARYNIIMPGGEELMPDTEFIRRTAKIKLTTTLGLKVRTTPGGPETGNKCLAGQAIQGIGDIVKPGPTQLGGSNTWTEIISPFRGFIAMEYLDNIVEIPLPNPNPTPVEDKPKRIVVEMESGKKYEATIFTEVA